MLQFSYELLFVKREKRFIADQRYVCVLLKACNCSFGFDEQESESVSHCILRVHRLVNSYGRTQQLECYDIFCFVSTYPFVPCCNCYELGMSPFKSHGKHSVSVSYWKLVYLMSHSGLLVRSNCECVVPYCLHLNVLGCVLLQACPLALVVMVSNACVCVSVSWCRLVCFDMLVSNARRKVQCCLHSYFAIFRCGGACRRPRSAGRNLGSAERNWGSAGRNLGSHVQYDFGIENYDF